MNSFKKSRTDKKLQINDVVEETCYPTHVPLRRLKKIKQTLSQSLIIITVLKRSISQTNRFA